MKMRKSLEQRFMEKVHPEPMSGCWLWGGCIDSKGYGQIRRGANTLGVAQATAVSLGLRGVVVPAGMVVCHRCDNPPCVNPDHLFIGTHKDNSDDKIRKGRGNPVKGVGHYQARITDSDVISIRRAYKGGATLKELSATYGLNTSAIGHVVVGRTWKHVLEPIHRKNRSKEAR
jgi:hypothetical protein